MNITVIGLGYIGSVTAACLSRHHHVTGIDISKSKVDLINEGKSPIVEPAVDELIQAAHRGGKLKAVYDSDYQLDQADAIIICVGTPSNSAGEVDLTVLINVTKSLCKLMKNSPRRPAILYRSTVPPGTMRNIILDLYHLSFPAIDFPILYHPEFLREGSAVADFFENPQVVVAPLAGIDEQGVEKLVREIYHGIPFRFYCVSAETAEMIKYLNNSYHALKVVFANEVARICSTKGIDTQNLFKIFLDDQKLNISRAYLTPGFAFGGSCLPKDLRGITTLARHGNMEIPILANIERSNEEHIHFAFKKIIETGLNKIGFFGLSFKPETDDVRESAYVKLIERLMGKGKDIRIFDESIKLNQVLGKNLEYLIKHIPHISQRLVASQEDLINFSELIVLCHFNRGVIDACRSNDNIVLMDMTGKLEKGDLSPSVRSLLLHDSNSSSNS